MQNVKREFIFLNIVKNNTVMIFLVISKKKSSSLLQTPWDSLSSISVCKNSRLYLNESTMCPHLRKNWTHMRNGCRYFYVTHLRSRTSVRFRRGAYLRCWEYTRTKLQSSTTQLSKLKLNLKENRKVLFSIWRVRLF